MKRNNKTRRKRKANASTYNLNGVFGDDKKAYWKFLKVLCGYKAMNRGRLNILRTAITNIENKIDGRGLI